MPSGHIFSSPAALDRISAGLRAYLRLPFASGTIPGAVLESILASVRDASVLRTYDFVDVLKESEGLGWQVKCTLEDTPVTWMRAKIPNSSELIEQSMRDKSSVQDLGNTILEFCNQHAFDSLNKYDLNAIGYSRLIVHKNLTATYFEKQLVTLRKRKLFNPSQFKWHWSKQKSVGKKGQLSAFHGIHIPSGKKWLVWHGRGENQLHFTGEKNWWPSQRSLHRVTFSLPSISEQLEMDEFIKLLSR